MAWYKNLETGLIWELVGDLEKQVSTNPIFLKVVEEVKPTKQKPQKNKSGD